MCLINHYPPVAGLSPSGLINFKTLKRCYHAILLCSLLLLTDAVAEINTYPFDNPVTEQRFKHLINELRCPKCQNQNLADSNAPLADDLRDKVYQMLQQGQSDQQIVQFLVDRYGDFVLYRPPLRESTWILWFGPFALGLVAAGCTLVWIRRRKPDTIDKLDLVEQHKLAALLNTPTTEPLTRTKKTPS